MNGIDLLLGVTGTLVTLLVLVGMVLMTPRGAVAVHTEGTDPEGSNLSPVSPREAERAPVEGR